ncbi:MAG: GAF domain-containing protein [Candidatus Bipolaricaulia bacterium]
MDDLKPLLQPIVDQAARLLDITDAGLYVYDAERHALQLVVDHSDVYRDDITGLELAVGEGLAGQAVESGKTAATPDYQSIERRPEIYRDMPWQSAMSVPLTADGEMLGALSVADPSGNRMFTERDEELVQVFAEQAALTLSHAQKLTQEQRWSRALHRLNELSQQWLQSHTDRDALLENVLDAGVELLACYGGGLYLYDAERGELELTVLRQHRAETSRQGLRIQLGEGVAGRAAETGQPEAVSDYERWHRRSSQWVGYEIRSVIGVPLYAGDRLIGAMSIYDREPHDFDADDVKIAEVLGEQAAIAIQRASMADLNRRLQEIAAQMLRTTEQSGLDDVLESVTQALVDYSPFRVAATSVFAQTTPLDHPEPPDVWNVHVVGLSPDQEAELRRHTERGEVIANRQILERGQVVGQGYYVSPQALPEAASAGVPVGDAPDADAAGSTWGPYDTFVYFVMLGGRAIGRITLSDPVHGLIPSRAELEPVESFVKTAAVAVQQARYQTRLRVLYRITRELGAKASTAGLYDDLLGLTQELIRYDYAAILRLEPEGLALKAQAGHVSCPYSVGTSIPIQEGVTGWVARHGSSQLLADVNEDDRFIQGSVQMGSELAVPIQTGDVILGVLNLESRRTQAFDEEDRELLETLADQLAVAISNLERRERLQAFQTRLHSIYGLTERLSRIEDLDDLYAQAVGLIHDNFRYDYVVLLTLEGDRLVPRGLRSKLPEAELIDENFRQLAPDRGLTGWAARHRQAVLVNDIAHSEHYIPGHPDIQAELAVPIVESGQVLGVLNIESTQTDAFSRDDRQLLEALARQLGVAMRSLQRRTRVEELNDFLRELNEIEGVNALLERVLKRVISLLQPKAEGGSVMFYDESSDQFVFRAMVGRDIEQLRDITFRPSELDALLNADGPTFLTASDQRTHPATEQFRAEGATLPASTLSLPIRERESGQAIAILHVNNFHEEGIFDDSDADVLLQLSEEITAALLRARDREQLRELATRDALTGAYNRHYLNEFLQHERERSERYAHPLSLVMVDINGFYEVNDRYGHAEGDRVLRELAQLLIHNVRLPDRVVRYGGDEFVIVMPETQEDDAREAMARIEQLVDAWDPGLEEVTIGFSFGIASWTPDSLKQPEEILNEADAFMYRRRSGVQQRRAHKREISQAQAYDDSDNFTGPA